VAERVQPLQSGHGQPHLAGPEVGPEAADTRCRPVRGGEPRRGASGEGSRRMVTGTSRPPTIRFHGGSDRSSRFRSAQAASCAASQTSASIRATRGIIRRRWRRSRRSPQYELTRRRSSPARPTYSTRPLSSRKRYTPGAAGSAATASGRAGMTASCVWHERRWWRRAPRLPGGPPVMSVFGRGEPSWPASTTGHSSPDGWAVSPPAGCISPALAGEASRGRRPRRGVPLDVVAPMASMSAPAGSSGTRRSGPQVIGWSAPRDAGAPSRGARSGRCSRRGSSAGSPGAPPRPPRTGRPVSPR
jgi:hypothetical protein